MNLALTLDLASGASPFGNSYLVCWAECRKRWFNQFLRPQVFEAEDGTKLQAMGLAPRHTDPNLSKGRMFHHGLASWFLSGIKDGEDTGEYNLNFAIAGIDQSFEACKGEYSDPAVAAQDYLTIQALMISYHEAFGPKAAARDWPTISVVCDDEGHPYIEREFRMDLGGGRVFTCRADTIVRHHGYLKVFEHKTSTVRGVGGRLGTLQRDSQFTGELFTLTGHFPDEPLNGVLVNVVPKDRGPNSKFRVAERETTTRTPEQLEQWRLDALSMLQEIDDAVGAFNRAVESGGHTVEQAAALCFPETGEFTGRCYKYNRQCEFWDLCERKGREDSVMFRFRPKTTQELEHARLFSA